MKWKRVKGGRGRGSANLKKETNSKESCQVKQENKKINKGKS